MSWLLTSTCRTTEQSWKWTAAVIASCLTMNEIGRSSRSDYGPSELRTTWLNVTQMRRRTRSFTSLIINDNENHQKLRRAPKGRSALRQCSLHVGSDFPSLYVLGPPALPLTCRERHFSSSTGMVTIVNGKDGSLDFVEEAGRKVRRGWTVGWLDYSEFGFGIRSTESRADHGLENFGDSL
jgi:hypothetical protein